MCAEGTVCGAITHFFILGFFFNESGSSGLSGHTLGPHITIMTVSTTRLNDTIDTL